MGIEMQQFKADFFKALSHPYELAFEGEQSVLDVNISPFMNGL